VRSRTPAPDPGTIVAIATGRVAAAIGVVRLSGSRAVLIADELVQNAAVRVRDMPDRAVQRVRLGDPSTGEVLDEALLVVMRAPRSYTGEDIVELSCHGSVALLDLLVERCVALGARLAEPGEFTRRAFVNGHIDLAQAEAVAMLIGARDERAVKAAARAVLGGLGVPLRVVRERLVDLIAWLEVALDFPEEQDTVTRRVDTTRQVIVIAEELKGIAARMRRPGTGSGSVTVAVVGAPNAGKSTLFNALVGDDRAIVSPSAGTTRDVIEAPATMAGIDVMFRDTAGLGTAADPIEAEGIVRARRAVADSDVLLVAIDGTNPDFGSIAETDSRDMEGGRRLLVMTKADLSGAHCTTPDSVVVSAMTGQGMDQLRERLAREILMIAGDARYAGTIAASERQRHGLRRAIDALEEADAALAVSPSEVVLVDLSRALTELDQVLGIDTGGAVLDRVFSTFCIGK
jgi:tRNA modification GTPase